MTTMSGKENRPKAGCCASFVMVNPVLEIIDHHQEARYEDGCLSIPGVYEPGVLRERAVRVRYRDEYGKPHTLEADDYLARVFQHEYEHLDGKLYLDRLPKGVKDKHRVYLASLQRQAKAYLKGLGER
jgi:peptide deformylase